jgi:hypothetical protein
MKTKLTKGYKFITEEMKSKYYWQRINDIEARIEELANRGVPYYIETKKRKSLLNNVRRLEKAGEK